jgi:hemerythrin-like domain-containing protein/prefoldin subunit 5
VRSLLEPNSVADSTDDALEFEDQHYSYSRAGPSRKVSRKAPADRLSDILETLYSEHRYLASLLDNLDKQIARLKPGKIPDYHLLLDIIDYLTHYPDQYHHPREDLLFNSMLEHDDGFKPLLERLEREHHTLSAYNHDLFHELTQIAAGRAVNRPELLHRIERYSAEYRKHMDYESREIFPRAKGSLSAADRRKLGEKTRYIDDPLFGGELQYKYRRLGRGLQARAEAVSQELVAREFSAIESTIEKLSGVVDTVENLKTAVERQGRECWREQKDTIRDHAQAGEGPKLVFLPLALIKNHGRQWRDGIAEIRDILRGSGSEDANSSRKR